MSAITLLPPAALLALPLPRHVAVTGAGGKTSLIASLAAALIGQGQRAIISTTTHMWPPEHPVLAEGKTPRDIAYMLADMPAGAAPVLGQALDPATGKLIGLAPDVMDNLRAALPPGVFLLVEADGAAGRPLKAHAPHEPVIPPGAELVIAVAGLNALLRPLAEAVHRPEIAARLLDIAPDAPLEPRHVAALLLHPSGPFRGAQGRRAVALNTQGRAGLLPAAEACAHALFALRPDIAVFAGPCRFPSGE